MNSPEDPALDSQQREGAVYFTDGAGVLHFLGSGRVILDAGRWEIRGVIDRLGELAHLATSASIEMRALSVSLSTRRYIKHCLRPLHLRAQAIAKARGKNWRNVKRRVW